MNTSLASTADRLAERLIELIAIPSPSFHERALADHLERQLRDRPGLTVERIGENLVVRLTATGGRPQVILCGHLDTVPAQDNETPRRDGDLIWGLGASDLKAGLAVLLELLETLDPARVPFDPVFVFYAREEVAFSKSGLIEVDAACPWLRDSVFAICVEPTDNFVEIGCNGTMNVTVGVRGTSAHSARPWLGDNAIHRAAAICRRVAAVPERVLADDRFPDAVWREVISVTTIDGGLARNMVPANCSLNVNFRFGPDRTIPAAQDFVRELVGQDGEPDFVDAAPSARAPAESPIWTALVAATSTGQLRAKQAWTDVGRFHDWGIDAVSFGPGFTAKAHQADEFASIDHMVASLAAFRTFCGLD